MSTCEKGTTEKMLTPGMKGIAPGVAFHTR